jgi:predicted RNA-binding Zn-ribbon protein involved in translation (DUF1610 family)
MKSHNTNTNGGSNTNNEPVITGPHVGHDKTGESDHEFYRCEECGLESTDERLTEGCFRCGAGAGDDGPNTVAVDQYDDRRLEEIGAAGELDEHELVTDGGRDVEPDRSERLSRVMASVACYGTVENVGVIEAEVADEPDVIEAVTRRAHRHGFLVRTGELTDVGKCRIRFVPVEESEFSHPAFQLGDGCAGNAVATDGGRVTEAHPSDEGVEILTDGGEVLTDGGTPRGSADDGTGGLVERCPKCSKLVNRYVNGERCPHCSEATFAKLGRSFSGP